MFLKFAIYVIKSFNQKKRLQVILKQHTAFQCKKRGRVSSLTLHAGIRTVLSKIYF